MRIILLQALNGAGVYPVFPIALAQLAGRLSGHDVRGYDPNILDEPWSGFEEICSEFKPDLVGVSFRNVDSTQSHSPRSYLPELGHTLKTAKSACPDSAIAIGGTGFSLFPVELMEKYREIDVGFYLESENSFCSYVDNPSNPELVKGLYYRHEGKTEFTGSPDRVDLSAMESPDFDLFPVAEYNRFGNLSVGIEYARGCPFNCLHCTYPFFSGKDIYRKSIDGTLAELEGIASRGVEDFFWTDNVFNSPKEPSVELCRAIIDGGIRLKWGASFTEKGFDAEYAELVYRAGCRRYFFAPDGISEKSAKTYGRDVPSKVCKQTYKLASGPKDNQVYVCFLAGSPGEGVRDLLEFAGMLFFLVLRLGIFRLCLSYTRIYPNTGIREVAVKKGIVGKSADLLEPTFYYEFPSSLARFIFHPVYKAAGFLKRLFGR